MQTGHNEWLVPMKLDLKVFQRLSEKWRSMGVRGRLFASFFAVSAFGVSAALAGMVAFHLVGKRLQDVANRNTSALSILELSRSTERVLGGIPGLLVVSDQEQRKTVSRGLTVETESLKREFLHLLERGHYADRLQAVGLSLTGLSVSLGEMNALVEERLMVSESVFLLQAEAHLASREITRLLSPWIQIVDMQIPVLIASSQRAAPLQIEPLKGQLSSLMDLQRHTQIYGRHVSTLFDFLSESSQTTDQARLQILAFQLERELRRLNVLDAVFDPRLRQSLKLPVKKLETLSLGSESLPAVRLHELQLYARGVAMLEEMVQQSSALTSTVDRIVSSAKLEMTQTIDGVQNLQQQGARLLIVLIVLSLLTSLLVFRRYVGGNILRRLHDLSTTMSAITQGNLSRPVVVNGDDEISEMSRAVEQFRQNTRERDELLFRQSRIAVQLEEQVQVRTAELRDANEFKSRFLASASHDIRQPLNALNLFVGELNAARSTADHQRLMERIGTSVNCMNDLFDGLLDMSRLEAGVLKPEYSHFPVDQLLDLLETTFSVTSSARGLRFRVVQSKLWVRSDATLLKRILLNLVSNALQCTLRGGVVVGCRRSGQQVRIDVIDTGPGIPADQLQAVFEEHYQLAHYNAGTSGLGLGLTIVKRLTDLLDCPLEVHSTLGKGTCFSITLPVVAERYVATSDSLHQARQSYHLTGICVVVIDDDPLMLECMNEMIHRWGCTVVACANSNQALGKLSIEALSPDIIICDVHLANESLGVDAIASIRKVHGQSVTACLITGDTTEPCRQDAIERGLYLMRKPLAAMTLRTVMNRLLEKSDAVCTCEETD